MRNLLFTLFFAGLMSCSGSGDNQGQSAAQLTFDLTIADTLIIDPGEEILYLPPNLSPSQIDRDSRYLYNFNQRDNSMEVIDLDYMKLDRKIQFEKEGPNGTGGYIQNTYYTGKNNILLSEFHQFSLFNAEAEKTGTYKILDQQYIGDSLLPNEALSTHGVLDDKEENFITIYRQGFGEPLGIAKVRLSDFMLKKIPVPGLKELAKFRVVFSEGGGSSAYYPGTQLSRIGDKIIISNRAVNEVFAYDPKNDTVHHYPFSSQITPNNQNENLRINVSSQEEFQKLISERRKDVSFAPIVYDRVNDRYYRFSQKFEKDGPEGNIYQPVLTIFDANFSQIFETDQLPVDKMFDQYFAKDGKLYLYENIMDEMGFIVMEVKEK